MIAAIREVSLARSRPAKAVDAANEPPEPARLFDQH
jgi:hypothetical protein